MADADLPAVVAVRALARGARLLERSCQDADGMSLAQYRMLAMVARGDERASHLAGRLALARPSVTAVVDGLVERGWLARSAVAGDRRAARISLTDEGREVLAKVETAMAYGLEEVLGAEHAPVVLPALGRLGLALDAAVAERMATPPAVAPSPTPPAVAPSPTSPAVVPSPAPVGAG